MKLNDRAEIIKGKKDVFTHIVVAAHQDDIEIMCGDGIAKCYNTNEKGLVAVIVSNGEGSPRDGKYKQYTNEQMIRQRRIEQINAGKLGQYSRIIFLNYKSNEIQTGTEEIVRDLCEIILHYKCRILYTHNPADKHKTHIGVLKNTIKALKKVPEEYRPEKVYGCECWRDLDWLCDEEKVIFDLSGYGRLLRKILGMHKSQIAGGKRYDIAVDGRRKANATFYKSHSVDNILLASFGLDMTELMEKDEDLEKFILKKIENFKNSVKNNLQ